MTFAALSQPLAILALAALARASDPVLEHVAVIKTAGEKAEIVSVQAATRRAALTHAKAGTVEIFDLTDPARPRPTSLFDLELAEGEELTSVALPPQGDWLLACVKARTASDPGRLLAHSLADGKLLASFPCGPGPDCVAISPSGRHALVANEGEGFEEAKDGPRTPPGSFTHVLLAADLSSSEVRQIALAGAPDVPTDGRTVEREVGDDTHDLPLGNGADSLEPEAVAFLPDESAALITLQENNLVARVNLEAGTVQLIPLGNSTHPSDVHEDGRFDERASLTARREPDGIALTPDGRYFVTADEGDTGPSFVKTPAGKPVGGSRTLSVFELATGKLVGDTGPELDRATAVVDLFPDGRATKRGCEPEMVLALERGGRTLAVVTLERAGALALVDLADPARPRVLSVQHTGAAPFHDEPEGLAHLRDGDSDYFYVANEGTGTLGVLRIRQ